VPRTAARPGRADEQGRDACGSKTCDTPIEKTVQLAQRFGVRGTPAMYLANGQQIGGYLPLDKIEQALNSVK